MDNTHTNAAERVELGYSYPAGTSLIVPEIRPAHVVWKELLSSATRSIDIAQLYFAVAKGSIVEQMIDDLIDLYRKDVRIRILVDEGMHARNQEAKRAEYLLPLTRLQQVGIELRLAPYGRLTGGALHAKFIVIDQQRAWLGSHNFDWRALQHIMEVGVGIYHEDLAGNLSSIFQADWRLSGASPSLQSDENVTTANTAGSGVSYQGHHHLARIVASPAGGLPEGIEFDLSNLLMMVEKAERNISLQLRKYTVTPRQAGEKWLLLDSALRSAARRGVQIRIMIDRRINNADLATLRSLASVQNVSVRFLKVPELDNENIPFARMLHAKTMTVDGRRAWIGTGNCSPDDFLHSRNVGLVVTGAQFVTDVQRLFDVSWFSEYAFAL